MKMTIKIFLGILGALFFPLLIYSGGALVIFWDSFWYTLLVAVVIGFFSGLFCATYSGGFFVSFLSMLVVCQVFLHAGLSYEWLGK